MKNFDLVRKMSRRDFIRCSGAASILLASQGCSFYSGKEKTTLREADKNRQIWPAREIDSIKVFTDEGEIDLRAGKDNCWGVDDIEI